MRKGVQILYCTGLSKQHHETSQNDLYFVLTRIGLRRSDFAMARRVVAKTEIVMQWTIAVRII